MSFWKTSRVFNIVQNLVNFFQSFITPTFIQFWISFLISSFIYFLIFSTFKGIYSLETDCYLTCLKNYYVI